MAENHRPGGKPGPEQGSGVPRWVRVIGIVSAALAVLLVLARVTGIGGHHGPGQHLGGPPPTPALAVASGAATGSVLGGPGW